MKRVGDESCELQSKKKKDFNEDSNFINYLPELPSLQNIAIASIAVSLWTKFDMKTNIEKNYHHINFVHADLEQFEEISLKKLDAILLPSSLKVEISKYAQPIISELLKCNGRNDKYKKIYDLLKVGDFLQWTVRGTIDMDKSLSALISSNMKNTVPLEDLYKFACSYCLVDSIPKLWSKLPRRRNNLVHWEDYNYHIVEYWNAVRRNQLPKLLNKLIRSDYNGIYNGSELNLYQNMTTLSVYTCNKSALNYFWPKMTDQEKSDCVERWLGYISHKLIFPSFRYQEYYEEVDILCFLLSHLKDADQQNKFFNKYSFLILRSLFFTWPYQRFFLPTITKMMEYIDVEVYTKIIADIFIQIKRGRTATELFREVWHLSPLKLKTKCIRKLSFFVTPIGDLISIGDSETALIILKDASYNDSKLLIFCISDNVLVLSEIINSKRLNLLDEVLLKTVTPNDIKFFKQHIATKHANSVFISSMRKGNFLAAKEFLDWCYESPPKKKVFKRTEINPMTFYTDFIHHGDYENYNQFMKWFFQTEEKISKFKRSSLLKLTSSIEAEMLKVCLYEGKDAWIRFEKFIDFNTRNAFTSRQLSKFKKLCVKNTVFLLNQNQFEFASRLVNWCFDSIAEVVEFKNKLINSDKGLELFNKAITNWNTKKNVIKWFSPILCATVEKLKNALPNKLGEKYNTSVLFDTFDFFVAKYNSSDSISDFEDDDQVNKSVQTDNNSNIDADFRFRSLALYMPNFSDSEENDSYLYSSGDDNGSFWDTDDDDEFFLDSADDNGSFSDSDDPNSYFTDSDEDNESYMYRF